MPTECMISAQSSDPPLSVRQVAQCLPSLVLNPEEAGSDHRGSAADRARASKRIGWAAVSSGVLVCPPWKDADPDIPIVKQAKAEYAKGQ